MHMGKLSEKKHTHRVDSFSVEAPPAYQWTPEEPPLATQHEPEVGDFFSDMDVGVDDLGWEPPAEVQNDAMGFDLDDLYWGSDARSDPTGTDQPIGGTSRQGMPPSAQEAAGVPPVPPVPPVPVESIAFTISGASGTASESGRDIDAISQPAASNTPSVGSRRETSRYTKERMRIATLFKEQGAHVLGSVYRTLGILVAHDCDLLQELHLSTTGSVSSPDTTEGKAQSEHTDAETDGSDRDAASDRPPAQEPPLSASACPSDATRDSPDREQVQLLVNIANGDNTRLHLLWHSASPAEAREPPEESTGTVLCTSLKSVARQVSGGSRSDSSDSEPLHSNDGGEEEAFYGDTSMDLEALCHSHKISGISHSCCRNHWSPSLLCFLHVLVGVHDDIAIDTTELLSYGPPWTSSPSFPMPYRHGTDNLLPHAKRYAVLAEDLPILRGEEMYHALMVDQGEVVLRPPSVCSCNETECQWFDDEPNWAAVSRRAAMKQRSGETLRALFAKPAAVRSLPAFRNMHRWWHRSHNSCCWFHLC